MTLHVLLADADFHRPLDLPSWLLRRLLVLLGDALGDIFRRLVDIPAEHQAAVCGAVFVLHSLVDDATAVETAHDGDCELRVHQ